MISIPVHADFDKPLLIGSVASVVGGAARLPLGILTKSSSTVLESGTTEDEAVASRRYTAKERRLSLQCEARDMLPFERIAQCLRSILPGKDGAQIWYSAEHDSAHFAQLLTCGSVWHCPVCAAKISERRRLEVAAGVAAWRERGGLVVLATFTLSHNQGERLRAVLDRLTSSRNRMLSGRKAVSFKLNYGVAGTIRGLEETHGSNGWHPHHHVLFFLDGKTNVSTFASELKSLWVDAVSKEKGIANWNNGCDVQIADKDIGDYITKIQGQWDESHELTKNNAKLAKQGGRSPLQLLSDASEGDAKARILWQEHAITMKGQRFIVWSKGLRELLGLNKEQTDEEIAEEKVEDAVLIATLSKPAWRCVLGNDARGDILSIAAEQGFEGICTFLRLLGLSELHMPLPPGYKPPTLPDIQE